MSDTGKPKAVQDTSAIDAAAAQRFTSAEDEINKAYKGLATGVKPFARYAGDRFAPPTPEHRRVVRETAQNVGDYAPDLARARNQVGLGGRAFPSQPQQISQYMNPYRDLVTDRIAQMGNKNFTNKILPALDAKYLGLGQYGSYQHQKAALDAAQELQSEISALQGQFLHEGYKHAGEQYEKDAQRALEAGRLYGVLSQDVQAQRIADMNALLQAADVDRGMSQEKKDFEYEQHMQEQQHPYEMANWYLSGMKGIPYTMSQNRTIHYNAPNANSMRLPQYLGMAGSMLANSGIPGMGVLGGGLGVLGGVSFTGGQK